MPDLCWILYCHKYTFTRRVQKNRLSFLKLLLDNSRHACPSASLSAFSYSVMHISTIDTNRFIQMFKKFLLGSLKGRNHLKELNIDKLNLSKQDCFLQHQWSYQQKMSSRGYEDCYYVARHLSPCALHCQIYAVLYALEAVQPSLMQPRPVTMWLPCVQSPQERVKSCRYGCDKDVMVAIVQAVAKRVLCAGNPSAEVSMGWQSHHSHWVFYWPVPLYPEQSPSGFHLNKSHTVPNLY